MRLTWRGGRSVPGPRMKDWRKAVSNPRDAAIEPHRLRCWRSSRRRCAYADRAAVVPAIAETPTNRGRVRERVFRAYHASCAAMSFARLSSFVTDECIPPPAARRPNATLVERAGDRLQRVGAGSPDCGQHREHRSRELVGRGSLHLSTDRTRKPDVAWIAKLRPARLPRGLVLRSDAVARRHRRRQAARIAVPAISSSARIGRRGLKWLKLFWRWQC